MSGHNNNYQAAMDVPTNYPPPASPYMGAHNKHPSPPPAFGNPPQTIVSYETHQVPHSAQQVVIINFVFTNFNANYDIIMSIKKFSFHVHRKVLLIHQQ